MQHRPPGARGDRPDLVGGLLWNFLARPPEEHHLELEFGPEYKAYKKNVGCWIPRLRPYEGQG